ncbi:hypothetical protein C7974DRAFT_396216 [Boeremia exigua]|uniref:uncharacterized protein n=1 Tax=Boeremia exigua TaxID=749465 RepID=UPI001E8E6CD7|nr:uncharacterized protein C7974DRAFT_396216 [Boeremia exigua]KAH6625520.1 hypothetical protein C7974DRAFT_396216 [Boeremia exigua]
MPPFSRATELVRDLTPSSGSPDGVLPGQPSIALNDGPQLRVFLEDDLCSQDLETMAPRLWILTTPSSDNINALHRQWVKGREIIVTEEPRLHLVWIHHRIFIKPIPRYLLSYEFWESYLDEGSNKLDKNRSDIRKAAAGFLRTYRYLIRRETDFNIAQQEHLRLIPKDVDWAAFCRFTAELSSIDDSAVSGRHCYGELRLTRLNLYAPLLLRKFHFEQMHNQYSDFFARLYGPILFVFALVSTALSSMQVALAAEQLVTVQWVSVWYVSRWFSMLSLVGSAIVTGWFVLLWLWMFLDEWVYTSKRKLQKRAKGVVDPRC